MPAKATLSRNGQEVPMAGAATGGAVGMGYLSIRTSIDKYARAMAVTSTRLSGLCGNSSRLGETIDSTFGDLRESTRACANFRLGVTLPPRECLITFYLW
jgi:hypothetical protein